MKNKTIFNSLNKETQEYLRVVYSLINYFNNNNVTRSITNADGETIHVKIDDGHHIIGLSLLLAGIYVDGFTKDFAHENDVTFEKCFGFI